MSDKPRSEPANGPGRLGPYEIELRMLAARRHVPALRALVAEQAMRADHDLDFVDDVRLALDEVCSIMLANSSPTQTLTVRLLVGPGRIEIEAWLPIRADARPSVDGLSSRVLYALAETFDHGVDEINGARALRLFFARSQPALAAGR